MSPAPFPPKSPRWLRGVAWYLTLFGLALLVAVLLLVLNLTQISLWAANHFLPEWRFDAARMEIDPKGAVTIRGFTVHLRDDGSEVLSLKKARIAFSWRELRKRHLSTVELDGLRVSANDNALAKARELLSADSSETSAWRIDRFALRNGLGKVALAGQPQIDVRLDADIFSLGGNPGGGKSDLLRVRDLALRSPAGRDIVTIPDATLAFTIPELSDGHVRRLTVEKPQVSLTQEEVALMNATAPTAGPAMAWKIDDLAINGGKVRIDVPTLPVVEGSLTVQAQDLSSVPGGAQTPGQLRVENLSVTPRDALAIPATLTSATVQFTGSELLAGHLREVRLDGPSVSLNDSWKSVFAASGNGESSARSVPPVRIDRLILEGGKADIALAGIPAIKGLLAAEFRNLGTSDATVQSVEFHDLHIGLPDRPAGSFREWITLPKVKVTFNVEDLVHRHRLKTIDVDGATLRFDREGREVLSKKGNTSPAPASPFMADEVRLHGARVVLDDLGLGIPPLDFALNLDLTNVPLNDPLSGDTPEAQTLELSNINFVSPLDPFVPVLGFHSVFIRWTPSGLRERQIEEVTIVGPEIHIGPDLFWYLDLVDKRRAAAEIPAPDAAPPRPWRVKRFDATSGKLILALAGQARLTLPMPFESHAENLDFQRLSDAKVRLSLDVPPQDYENNELDIHLTGVSGKIGFQIPPGTRAENVVQTLQIREVRWRNFRGSDWWLGLTFDQKGVHGDGGGKICSGDVRAAFTYFLDPRAPWTGWVSGTRLDLKEITDKLATGRASMTGRAAVSLAVNGVGGELTRIVGDFRAPTGGLLRITKLDDIIAAIPDDWESTKRDLMLIGLQSLRDFPYTTGKASFWLTEPVGQLNVRLDGSLGRRELELNINPPGDLNRLFLFSPLKP